MSVSELEDLYKQLRSVRAQLPQMVNKLAFVSDDSDSSALFQTVASDLAEWQSSVEKLEMKYNELKPQIDKLNKVDV